MQEQTVRQPPSPSMDYLCIIGKRKKLIIGLVVVSVCATAVISLFMTNIYRASAVITTVSERDSSSSAAMQMLSASGLAGMADIAGVSFPGGQKLNVLESYLKSNIVREKVIVKNGLLPVLFPRRWDAEKKEWKRQSPGFLRRTLNVSSRVVATHDAAVQQSEEQRGPTISDGLRVLQGMITIKSNVKANTLTITVDDRDPRMASNMVACLLEALQDHLSEEKKRSANENRDYLKGQLVKAVDPLTRQKIYSLLSKQIETALMAEVKGNIFTVIDPPRVPDRKVRPNRTRLVINAFILSLILAVFLAVYLEKREK
ncbi:MAG: Wzz/FepE/Etk N-terminal domain-containing protein [Nitrospirae bacterium]|nr:Wzz/FepE/Etk N-terminal domain-containing protein [Nitrospirota bacterium]